MLNRLMRTAALRTSQIAPSALARRGFVGRPLLHPLKHLFDSVSEEPDVFKNVDRAQHILSTYQWTANEEGESERSVVVSSSTKDGKQWDCKVVVKDDQGERTSEGTGGSFEEAKAAATEKARKSLGEDHRSPEISGSGQQGEQSGDGEGTKK